MSFLDPLKLQSWSTNITFFSNFRILICRLTSKQGHFLDTRLAWFKAISDKFENLISEKVIFSVYADGFNSQKTERGFNTLQSLLQTNRALNLA